MKQRLTVPVASNDLCIQKSFVMKNLESKKRIYLGIILISLGVVMNTTLSIGSIGTVMIALGGLFFIAGMAKKREEDAEEGTE